MKRVLIFFFLLSLLTSCQKDKYEIETDIREQAPKILIESALRGQVIAEQLDIAESSSRTFLLRVRTKIQQLINNQEMKRLFNHYQPELDTDEIWESIEPFLDKKKKNTLRK